MNRSPVPARQQLRSIARRAMLERGLLPDFSPAALAEANAMAPGVAEAGASVRDLRGLLWASIDNDDSRDLDQLSVAEPMAGGEVKILVAIADVDAAVKQGCAVDAHARANTTSVYTAAQIFPMLPERLSTDLTSLGEEQERLAIAIEMIVTQSGKVRASDVYRAVVRNRAKLAYDGVAAWLDGAAPAPSRLAAVPGMDEQLRVQDRVARAMKAVRHEHGALDLETLEVRAVFDGDILAELRPDEKNRAKALIEDFMIAANGVTARYLDAKRFPSVRRVLRSPERWEKIVALAAGLGERLPSQPDARALAEFLSRRKSMDDSASPASPERWQVSGFAGAGPTPDGRNHMDSFRDLSLSVVKLLGRGEYVLETPGERAEGHFGLAVKDYTHSTAPNRRFPDVITQRLLKAAIAGRPPPYGNQELGTLAAHCTEQEDNAAKVARWVGKSAAALLLQSRIGEKFDSVVTGASAKGTWVRILRPAVEGKVLSGFHGLDVGDRVRVALAGVDVERGFIDFVRAS